MGLSPTEHASLRWSHYGPKTGSALIFNGYSDQPILEIMGFEGPDNSRPIPVSAGRRLGVDEPTATAGD